MHSSYTKTVTLFSGQKAMPLKASAKNAVKGIVENAAKASLEEVDETKKVAAPKTVAKESCS